MDFNQAMFRMSLLKKCLVAGTIVVALAAAGVAGVYHWANSPINLTPPQLDVTVKPHSSLRSVTLQLNRGGVPVEPELFVVMTRVLGLQTQLKSGNYEFKSGVTPYEVLQKLARGDVNEYVATIIEGWTFKRMRAELDANPALKHDTAGMSDADLLSAIGAPEAVNWQRRRVVFPRHLPVRQEHQRPRRVPARLSSDARAPRRSLDGTFTRAAVQDAV